jgi:hypothetical protein
MRETADFVYNLLKYHAVKYLGVFNLMYKYIKANEEISKMEDVTGIDRLLSKLEYNALSSIGRKVSDYGVPTNVLTYFENYNKENDRSTELISFDDYEKGIVEKVKNLI